MSCLSWRGAAQTYANQGKTCKEHARIHSSYFLSVSQIKVAVGLAALKKKGEENKKRPPNLQHSTLAKHVSPAKCKNMVP